MRWSQLSGDLGSSVCGGDCRQIPNEFSGVIAGDLRGGATGGSGRVSRMLSMCICMLGVLRVKVSGRSAVWLVRG